MQYFITDKANWDKTLERWLDSNCIYASIIHDYGQDYETLTRELIPRIAYNSPKPASPLKNFFLPFRENVSDMQQIDEMRVILGVPACDLEGLKLLDEIYLDKDYPDPFYKEKRDHTLLISSDCFSVLPHCHCTSYGLNPWNEGTGDISIALIGNLLLLTIFTEKGEKFIELNNSPGAYDQPDAMHISELARKHTETYKAVQALNPMLPDYPETGRLVRNAPDQIWRKYASTCVSCGACAVICPTCSCFLLIDRENFGKIKQADACQYPGFERVAGGEDPLRRLHDRFRNRYFCKYVWKPEKFSSVACTGCGRCIEACLGRINKNELFLELIN